MVWPVLISGLRPPWHLVAGVIALSHAALLRISLRIQTTHRSSRDRSPGFLELLHQFTQSVRAAFEVDISQDRLRLENNPVVVGTHVRRIQLLSEVGHVVGQA